MYIVDGIAYAGERRPAIKISGARPPDGCRLWLRFNTGEVRVAVVRTRFRAVFRGVYLDSGATVRNAGEIDIAPERL